MKKNLMRIVTVFLALLLFSALSAGSLTVSAALGTVYESEPNNTAATADMTYDDYDSYGNISNTSDVDWWKVIFYSEGMANFYLGSIPSGCNYSMKVYDYTGTHLLVESLKSSNSSELCKIHVRANEAYYIKVYSESGYSSSNYKFRVKRYNLNDAVIYTTRWINDYTNYAGSLYEKTQIENMGFTTNLQIELNAAGVYADMPGNALVLFNYWGEPGGVQLHTSHVNYTVLHGTSNNSMPIADRAVSDYSSSALSDNLLIIYLADYTGYTSGTYGNLTDKTLTKGAFCCIGWKQDIDPLYAQDWIQQFLTYCYNGKNIGNARLLANSWADDHIPESGGIRGKIKDQRIGTSALFKLILG